MRPPTGLRILMIAPEPFFEPRGTPFSVYHRARALGELGHRVDLLTYPIGTPVSIPGVRIIRSWRPPFIRRVKIGPSVAKFPLDAGLFLRACSLLLRRRYDCIHTHEEAGLFGAVLGAVFRIPHLYDMHSDLAQQLTNFQFTSSGTLVRLMTWLQRFILRSARTVIVICPELRDTVERLTPGKSVILIENGAVAQSPSPVYGGGQGGGSNISPALAGGGSNFPSPLAGEGQGRGSNFPPPLAGEGQGGGRDLADDASLLRDALEIPWGAPVLMYTGTFEPYQGLELFVDAMPAVLHQFPTAVVILVGGHPEQVDRLRQRARRLGVESALRLTGQRPPDDMAAFTVLADILLSPRVSGTNTPLKIYTYLHAGKPILATRIRSHTQVLTPEISLLVEPSSEALAAGAIRLLADPLLQDRLARAAASLAEANYGYDTYLGHTSQAYAMLKLAPSVA